ncbi:MAG: PilN domain-containing protein [Pseudomonadales bacterium]|nr:PilN domain-containing protein [Pseudomonadales bacterium]
MANINLLPWREQRREQQRKEFFVILGTIAGLGLLAVLFAHVAINGQIDGQGDRNSYLQTNIAELDKQVVEIRELQTRRNQLIDRMQVIQNLQGTRPLIVRIFDELVRTLPDGVYFRSLQRKDSTITIAGTAETNNRVSSLMRQLEKSEWFANPILKGVRANPEFGDQANDFDMTVTVTTPGAAAAKDESGE